MVKVIWKDGRPKRVLTWWRCEMLWPWPVAKVSHYYAVPGSLLCPSCLRYEILSVRRATCGSIRAWLDPGRKLWATCDCCCCCCCCCSSSYSRIRQKLTSTTECQDDKRSTFFELGETIYGTTWICHRSLRTPFVQNAHHVFRGLLKDQSTSNTHSFSADS